MPLGSDYYYPKSARVADKFFHFFSEQNLILWRGNKYTVCTEGLSCQLISPFTVTSGSSQLNYSGWIIKSILTYSVLTLLDFLILLLFVFLF